jgi:hypothetical protein
MPSTNFYFNNYQNSLEQRLIEDLIIESIKIYGIECYYMPRDLVAKDELWGEDTLSKFDNAYQIEMYIKSVDGFEGDGDFLSKFGLEIRDEMTLTVSQRRFDEEILIDQTTVDSNRPMEGDLIYFPLNGKIFEVKFVEHEAVFYQMGSLQTYDLRCELFEYSHEILDTGIRDIDIIEDKFSGDLGFTEITLEGYLPLAKAIAAVTGFEVTTTSITDGGVYSSGVTPAVTFSDPDPSVNAALTVAITSGAVSNIAISNTGFGYANTTPVVVIGSPESGSNTATATVTVANNRISTVTITNAGSGYANTPVISITAAPDSVTAEGFAVTKDGEVIGITITKAGTNYTSIPTVTIDAETIVGNMLTEDGETIVQDSYRIEDTDSLANNEYYQTQTASGTDVNFIDWSESNPFGDL